MNEKRLLMFGRFEKNIVLVLSGIVFGGYIMGNKYDSLSLSRLDISVLGFALFIMIWDFYEWCKVFLKKEVGK